MNKRGTLVLLLPIVVLPLIAAVPSLREETEPVGGARYFFCAAFNFVKYAGMVTGRPDAVLVGAVGAGLSCAYGW